jgi:hypothetical protein
VISNRSVPEAAVIPELPYPDVREAAEWLTKAFGFKERLQIGDHRAQLVFENGAVIAIQGDAPGSTLLVRVPDADAHAPCPGRGRRRKGPERARGLPLRRAAVQRRGSRRAPLDFSQSIADVDPADWGGTLKE